MIDNEVICVQHNKREKSHTVLFILFFDKIGFFLNDYMKLGIKQSRVFFRSVWYDNGDANSKVISSKFLQSKNWPFRGLFWLSKDLHDKTFTSEMEPDARALSEIRNHLEHKYLKVHEIPAPAHETDSSNPYDWIGQAWKISLRTP
jgi:LA2681-like HEPN